ncbi:MAG: DNA polymerase domain-containing protein [Anaeromyxobacteraceae bacterium]
MTEVRGFIVSAWDEHRPDAPRRILATGRLEDGRSFALVLPAPAPAVYVAAADGPRAAALLADSHGATVDPTCWSDLAGAALARVHLPAGAADDAWRRLAAGGAPALHVERGRASDALLALGLAGPVALRGEPVPGRRVDVVFVNPELAPTAAAPTLAWLALDIETDRGGAVTAVSLAGAGGPGEVLFVGPAVDSPTVTSVPSERALLTLLGERLRARDPDVVTGWNVVDFDLQVLAARHAAHGIPFDVGRVPGGVALRSRTGVGRPVELTGRAVLDAMRLVRASGRRLDDLTLDGVAQAILGEGKTVSLRGEAKLRELERLQREAPARFCAYCLRDAELVLAILAKTGLDTLTARRAALTGVSLNLAWTSIPAFERIYGAALRTRRVVPPARTDAPISGAAGGTVLAAEAGLFENVLVLDFRSLYPSLMRTFHLDPLAHARATALPRPDDLVAPNGARFDRSEGILPGILERYAREREAALRAGDDTAAHVYKILQNSFYGVLGASGCRYARTELAGAITSFGQLFLRAARDWFEARGHEVLYGDTDSVFVRSGLRDDAGHAALAGLGRELAGALNGPHAERIPREHDVASHLAMRCEKVYRRFFIPRLRGDVSLDGRGRGKGYAGLLLLPGDATELEVRGMEAVRSDSTPLARRFQVELLRRLFGSDAEAGLRAFGRETAARLPRGELDGELVYRKALRRPAEAYESQTPQVRAARLLGWTDRRGRVDYVMTRAGPEPVEARSGAPLDYEHYLERQLRPIAQSIAQALGTSADDWLGDADQLRLFAPGRAASGAPVGGERSVEVAD